ncbi:MAG: TetR/AcrR family transcriptional regulator [Acidimicrobiales bacterium]
MSSAAPAEGQKSGGPRSKKGVQTRARLVDAAKKTFEENGYLETRVSDIAERAGLSHGSFYHYFDSKEQVFREVAAALDERLSAPLTEVVLVSASPVPPYERIREAIRLHFESYQAEAKIMGVIEQVSRYDGPVSEVRWARHERYRDQIADSIRQLQLRNMADRDLDPVIAASALGALTYRFAEMWLVQGAVDCTLEEGIDQVSKIFVNALGLDNETTWSDRRTSS